MRAGLAIVLFTGPVAHAADKKLAVSSASASASDALQSPVLGFVAPPDSPLLRSIVGTPGAAVLGDAVPMADTVTRVAASPAGTFVLAETSDGQPVSVIQTRAGSDLSLRPVPGAFPRCDVIEYSSSGYTAALYSASLERIQVVTGLPDAPLLAQEYDARSLPARVLSLAVNDAGSIVLAGTSDGQNGGVFRITTESLPARLMEASRPSALRIVPQTDSAVVADSQLNQVFLVSMLSETPSIKLLAGPDDGADGPHQIELFAGSRTAVVANLNSSFLLVIDLQQPKISRVALTAPAATLKPIRTRAGVTVSTTVPAAYWLLSGGPDSPVISFIADVAALADHQ